MMAQPFCHMHGPEHHIMVGMALLTAYPTGKDEDAFPGVIRQTEKNIWELGVFLWEEETGGI